MSDTTKTSVLILAAGMGARYGGLKQLDGIGPHGETIIDYSVYDAIKAGYDKIVFVIRKSFEADYMEQIVKKFDSKIEVQVTFQTLDTGFSHLPTPKARIKPWGTGHAVLSAAKNIKEPFITINADDFYGAESFVQSHKFLTDDVQPNKFAMIGYQLKNTLSENGTVSRGICVTDENHILSDVKEHINIARNKHGDIKGEFNKKSLKLNEDSVTSMNYWAFHPSLFDSLQNLFETFLERKRMVRNSEFYIPAVVNDLIKENKTKVEVITSTDQWYGVTYKDDKEKVLEALTKLTKAGKYPSPLF